mgnify:CR=1 FL=1
MMSKRLTRFAPVAVLAALGLALSGCSRDEDKRVAFDGFYFKTKAKKIDDDDLSRFSVTVQRAAQSLEGALQAGVYQGTQYCIAADGTSRIRWDVGPDTPPSQLVFDDGTLVMQGECNP